MKKFVDIDFILFSFCGIKHILKIQSDNKHQSGPLRSVLALPCPEYIRVEHSRSEIHIKRAVRERQEMP